MHMLIWIVIGTGIWLVQESRALSLTFICGKQSITATFTLLGDTIPLRTRNSYSASGTCTEFGTSKQVSWSAKGEFNPPTMAVPAAIATEQVTLNGPAPYIGQRTATYHCNNDPWASISTKCLLNNAMTTGPNKAAVDEFFMSNYLLHQAPFSAVTDPSDAQRIFKELLAAVGPAILSPAPGTLVLSQTTVPIKLAVPTLIPTTTSFLVRIKRRNRDGTSELVFNKTISRADATSPSGYLGWGAAGFGRKPEMISIPGTYSLTAYALYVSNKHGPRGAGQNTVEFTVISPKKAIQKGPGYIAP